MGRIQKLKLKSSKVQKKNTNITMVRAKVLGGEKRNT